MRHFLALCSELALCLFMSMGVTSAAPVPLPAHPWAMGAQGRRHDNQGRDEGHAGEHGKEARDHHEARRKEYRPSFSYRERGMIDSYFRRYQSELPPGLAKRGGHLPPGLAKQLREGGTLPPGLQKRLQPFPRRLSRELPPLPSGYRRVLLGPRALIISSRNVVIAIMSIHF